MGGRGLAQETVLVGENTPGGSCSMSRTSQSRADRARGALGRGRAQTQPEMRIGREQGAA